MAQIIKTTGEVIEVTPKNGKYFSLEELQSAVEHNGHHYIEAVNLFNGQTMIVNEEGRLPHVAAPYNIKATQIFRRAYPCDFIFGNVIVCNNNELN